MCNSAYIRTAIENVLGFDIPDHLIRFAIVDQANLLAGFDQESEYDDWELAPESYVSIPH